MGNVNENFTRVNIVLDFETMEKIDAYAKQLGLNRSSAVRFMCRQFLQSQKAIESFADMVDAIKAEQMKKVIESDVFRSPKK